MCTSERPRNAFASAARGPCGCRRRGELRGGALALLAGEQVDHRAAEQRWRRGGREGSSGAGPRAGGGRSPDGRGRSGRRTSARDALEQPRPAQLERRPRRRHPPRQVAVVLDDHPAGVQRGGAQRQHLPRAGDVRGAGLERRRGEDVQLRPRRPSRRRSGGRRVPWSATSPGASGLAMRQRRRAEVQHDGEARRPCAGTARRAARGCARASRRTRSASSSVGRVVPRPERRRGRFDPGHSGARPRAAAGRTRLRRGPAGGRRRSRRSPPRRARTRRRRAPACPRTAGRASAPATSGIRRTRRAP